MTTPLYVDIIRVVAMMLLFGGIGILGENLWDRFKK